MLLLLLSILPLLLFFLVGVVVIVDDLVPGTKLNIVIININDALDKLEKVDWHALSIPYFARQGTTVKVPRRLGWSALY